MPKMRKKDRSQKVRCQMINALENATNYLLSLDATTYDTILTNLTVRFNAITFSNPQSSLLKEATNNSPAIVLTPPSPIKHP